MSSPAHFRATRMLAAVVASAAAAAMLAFAGAPAAASGGGWAWIGQSSSGAPPPTTGAAAAFDAASGQVVVFGGDQQTTVGAYTYQSVTAATYAWTESTAGGLWTDLSSANGPAPRSGAAMAYDAATQQIVMFGGTAADGSTLSDTWTWDGTHGWQKGPTAGPSPRTGAAMAYDAQAGDIVLFGGESGGTPLQDTWTWNGSSWTRAATSGPSARANTALAFDANTNMVVLFGGQAGGAVFGDTWIWNGSTWQQQTLNPAPTGRAGASLVYDAATRDVVLFGGQSSPSASGALAQTWRWDGTSGGWASVSAPSAPPARFGAASAYYGAGGYAQDFVFGGTGADGNALGDAWVGQVVPPQLSITTAALSDARAGVAYSFQLGASDGATPYVWSVVPGAPLPGWLTLSSSGSLTGTPTSSDVGTVGVTVEVTDSTTPTAQAVQETFQLTVDPATLQVSTSSLAAATQGSPYSEQLQATGGTAPYAWTTDTGALPAGLSLSSTGIISGTPLVAGSQTITFTVTDSTYPIAQQATTVPITLSVGPPVLAIVTNAMPGALVGQLFDVTLQAVGGDPSGADYTWSVATGSHLPGWLALTSQGELSGTPGVAGSSTFTVQASDGNGHTAAATFTVTVAAPGTIVDNYNLLFTTSDQSQWSAGSQSTKALSLPIIPNYSFNQSGSAGDIATVGGGCFIGICVPTTYYGGSISAGINGEFGLSLDLSEQGGSVSISYPGNVQLSLTHAANSQVFTVATGWTPSPSGGSLSTTPPDATLAMDGEFGLGAYINGQVCVFSCGSFDIIPSFQIGPYNGQLFSINSNQVANTEIPLISLICSPLLYGSSCPGISGGVYYPAITINSSAIAGDGVSLQGNGSEPFFTVHANLATIIAKMLTEGASPPLSAGVSFSGVDLNYTLLNIGPTATFYLDQAVQFNPGTPTVTLSFPNAVNYSIHGGTSGTQQTSLSMAAGSTVDITAPWSGTSVTPTFSIPDNQFWNDTYVDSSTSWIFQALGLSATIGGKGVSLGPLVNLSTGTPTCSATTLNTADLIAGATQGALQCGIQALAGKGLTGTVHSFALGGFNAPSESPVAVKLDTTPPATTSDVTGSITTIGSAQVPTKWYDGAVTIQLTATDAGSGVASTTYTITGNNGTPPPTGGSGTNSATVTYNGGPHTFDTTVNVSAPGEYTMRYYSVDAAGNQETPSHVISFNYVPAPTITVVAPVNAASTVDTPVVITGTHFALPAPNGGSVVTAVSFGSHPAKTFTVVSATQIDATWQGLPNDVATPTAENIVVQSLSADSNAAAFTALPRPTVTKVVPVNGPESGGTTVLISGTGFTTVDGVFFGGQAAASFKVLSDTQIRAVTQPQTAGAPVDVTVHAVCSTAATADATACLGSLTGPADLFQFLPRPAVTGIQPARVLTTGQTPIVITGTGFTTTQAVYFGTTEALSFHIDGDTQITAYAPPGTGSVDVTVTTACADMYGQLWPQATSCLTSRASQNDQVTYVTFLALAPTGPGTLVLNGNAAMDSPYGSVVDDSAAARAVTLTGQAALSGKDIEVVGTVFTTPKASVVPTPAQGVGPMADPLAPVLTAPATAGVTSYGGAKGLHVTSVATLQPGDYPGGIAVSGQADVRLAPGTYVVGSGFLVSGEAQVAGQGVTLIIEPNGLGACSGFQASGRSVVTLEPPSTGPFAALAVWVHCPASARTPVADAVSVTGGAVVNLSGAVYAPGGLVDVTGQARLQAGSAVADTFQVSGLAVVDGIQ